MHQIFGLALSIAALVFGILHVRAEFREQTDKVAIYRPLTMIVILVIALIAPSPVSAFYKGAIILALVLSIVSDLLMMIPGTPLVIGMVGFTAVSSLFFLAFGSVTALRIPTPWVILLLLYGALLIWRLWPNLGELRGPTTVFMGVLGLAVWQAMELSVQIGQPWALFALVGSVSLVIASSVLGLDYFLPLFRGKLVLFFSAYYIGQWLIAASIWGRGLIPPAFF
jgi:uncharacterized membrane protein YhhN